MGTQEATNLPEGSNKDSLTAIQGSSIKKKLELRNLELNSLLEITQAINSNLPEASLYRIYQFMLLANLDIHKLVLYVMDDAWECKVSFGTSHAFESSDMCPKLMEVREPADIEDLDLGDSPFNEFQKVIPVAHKDRTLAFVFVGFMGEHPKTLINTNFIQVLSNIIIVAIENKKLVRRQMQQEVFNKEIEIARDVQRHLIPKDLPKDGALQMESSYLPHHTVGGDYFDYIPINEDKFFLCIADVSGKGIPAALLMSNFQAALRTLLRKTHDLKEIVSELNYQVLENAQGDNFITFFAAMYDKQLNHFEYVNAGHNPPFIVYDEQALPLELGCPVLGAVRELPHLNMGAIPGLKQFFLFTFTDGLVETGNPQEEQFGFDRVGQFVKAHYNMPLQEFHRNLLAELSRFTSGIPYQDDITMFSCKFSPGG